MTTSRAAVCREARLGWMTNGGGTCDELPTPSRKLGRTVTRMVGGMVDGELASFCAFRTEATAAIVAARAAAALAACCKRIARGELDLPVAPRDVSPAAESRSKPVATDPARGAPGSALTLLCLGGLPSTPSHGSSTVGDAVGLGACDAMMGSRSEPRKGLTRTRTTGIVVDPRAFVCC